VCGVHFGVDAEYFKLLMQGKGGYNHCGPFTRDDPRDDDAESWKGRDEEEEKPDLGGRFCCPNGHVQFIRPGQSQTEREIERLKEELARAKGRAEKMELDLKQARRAKRPDPLAGEASPGPTRAGVRTKECKRCGERKPYRGFQKRWFGEENYGQWACIDCVAELDAARLAKSSQTAAQG
jgi:hypothetical protein